MGTLRQPREAHYAEHFAVNSSLLAPEKWDAKIFAVFKSFVYRVAANRTLSKFARQVEYLFSESA
jgi:hypothetical protein